MSNRLAYLGGKKRFDPSLPFVKPFFSHSVKFEEMFRDVFQTGMLTKGKYLDLYEKSISNCQDGVEAVAVSSGTQGLILTLEAFGVGPGDEVIVPSFTFCATAHAVARVGAVSVFVDCDPRTFCIDCKGVEEACTERTKAIVAVHIFGVPADVDRLTELASEKKVPLIFDAAHAFGVEVNGRPVGTYGDASVFSTSPTKTLVTGEGGLVVTPHGFVANQVRLLREYGNPGDYNCTERGTNSRLEELSAITGLMSLEGLQEQVEKRIEVATLYRKRIEPIDGIELQTVPEKSRAVFKDMPIVLNEGSYPLKRDLLAKVLNAEGVPTKNYFDPPVHMMSCYAEHRCRRLPETERIARSVICLPMNAFLTSEDVEGVCEIIEMAAASSDAINERQSEDK